jgi:hypothetical protein
MQKQFCFGLGIALFCVAAVLYFNTNSSNNFDLRPVGKTEALTVNGGGSNGFSNVYGVTCGIAGSSGGCNGTNGIAGSGVGTILMDAATALILYDKNSDVVVIPQEIEEALQENVSCLDPISLVWVRTRTSDIDTETLLKKIKEEYSYSFLEPVNSTFMWQKGCGYLFNALRNRAEIDSANPPPLVHEKKLKLNMLYDIKSVDGEFFYSGGMTDDKPIVLMINPLSHPTSVLFQILTLNMGYKYPMISNDFENNLQPASYILYLAQKKENVLQAKSEIIDDEKIFLIKVFSEEYNYLDQCPKPRFFTFYLLPEYHYAVKQLEVHSQNNELVYKIVNKNFKKLSGKKVYLPNESILQRYTHVTISDLVSSTPLYTENFLITEVSTKKINNKQFNLKNKFSDSGTLITDRSLRDTDEGISYMIPDNPADLDRVIEAALNGTDFVPTPLPSTTAIVIKWLLCIAGIAMIVYAGYEKFFKKKKKQ